MDMIISLKNANLEPKRILFIHSFIDKPPNLMLIEAMKNGKPHVKWMPPLIIYNSDNTYTTQYLNFVSKGNQYG